MGKVNEFVTQTVAYVDTKLAGQTPGNGAYPAPFQMSLGTILAWIIDNLPEGSGFNTPVPVATSDYYFEVPPGRWLIGISVESETLQRMDIGSYLNGHDIAFDATIQAGVPYNIVQIQYSGTAGIGLYFDGFSGPVTLNFLIL